MPLHPREADISAADIYLQPHSDDICFSLGALADARHCGRLVTVFPISHYVAKRPGVAPPPTDQITRTRLAEDDAFAGCCGLHVSTLALAGAFELGRKPFDCDWQDENAARTRAPLMDALRTMGLEPAATPRPWLFCPSGIGGHVDHLAVMRVICDHYDVLRASYRIGFYEDLYYASDPFRRRTGLDHLRRALEGRALTRHEFVYSGRVARKLELLALYRSQFTALPCTVMEFTPATGRPSAPHEAIWTEGEDRPFA